MNYVDVIYDQECYKNVFLFGFKVYQKNIKASFEISHRRDDRHKIHGLMKVFVNHGGVRMVSFNGIGYDYPLLHLLLNNLMNCTVDQTLAALYEKSQAIIKSEKGFEHTAWESDWLVPQLDLLKINHYDNKARATGLKDLEYAMQAEHIVDLPYRFDEPVPSDGFDVLTDYMLEHDVHNTERFYTITKPKLVLREDYSRRLGVNVMNDNDTKLGKRYTQMQIEDTGYSFKDSSKRKKQTRHTMLDYGGVILPFISFKTPEFQSLHNFLLSFKTDRTKEVFKAFPTEQMGELAHYTSGVMKSYKRLGKVIPERVNGLSVVLNGLVFDIGSGGLHACIESCHAHADEGYTILDIDVTSFYPSIIIEHEVYPAHIGRVFCDVYKKMKAERLSYAKGTPENAMLKLALNGTYGDMNNQFSVFLDALALIKVTINGQLMLMMLAERLMTDPSLDLTMLQVNTDGMTFKVRDSDMNTVKEHCSEWEALTRMDLEEAVYSNVWIADVNNYMAEYAKGGNLKLKGKKFIHDMAETGDWHKDFSLLVVKKAVVAHLTNGTPLDTFIRNHTETYDFTSRAKVARTHKLLLDGVQTQRISRYYISDTGGELEKEMPPLRPDGPVRLSAVPPTKGYKVTIINDTLEVDRNNINYDFYIQQAQVIVEQILAKRI